MLFHVHVRLLGWNHFYMWALIVLSNGRLSSSKNRNTVESFISLLDPHMGEAWKRFIRSIKEGLRCAISETLFNKLTLRTIPVNIEMIVNSRSLTYVQTDEHSQEFLTPIIISFSYILLWGKISRRYDIRHWKTTNKMLILLC